MRDRHIMSNAHLEEIGDHTKRRFQNIGRSKHRKNNIAAR